MSGTDGDIDRAEGWRRIQGFIGRMRRESPKLAIGIARRGFFRQALRETPTHWVVELTFRDQGGGMLLGMPPPFIGVDRRDGSEDWSRAEEWDGAERDFREIGETRRVAALPPLNLPEPVGVVAGTFGHAGVLASILADGDRRGVCGRGSRWVICSACFPIRAPPGRRCRAASPCACADSSNSGWPVVAN